MIWVTSKSLRSASPIASISKPAADKTSAHDAALPAMALPLSTSTLTVPVPSDTRATPDRNAESISSAAGS